MSYGIERERERLDLGTVIVQKREQAILCLWHGCPNMVSKHVCRSHRPTHTVAQKTVPMFGHFVMFEL